MRSRTNFCFIILLPSIDSVWFQGWFPLLSIIRCLPKALPSHSCQQEWENISSWGFSVIKENFTKTLKSNLLSHCLKVCFLPIYECILANTECQTVINLGLSSHILLWQEYWEWSRAQAWIRQAPKQGTARMVFEKTSHVHWVLPLTPQEVPWSFCGAVSFLMCPFQLRFCIPLVFCKDV